MMSEKMVSELTVQYQEIMREKGATPTWAVHKKSVPNELVPCTIPFVGKYYANQEKKILVYASAENLVDYNERPGQDRFDEMDMAINRHRAFFQRPSGFFPNVHLQPMTDGALATAVAYLTMKLTGREPGEPREFYETIAFGNYGKYSIETGYQAAVRNNIHLSSEEKERLKKDENKNIDYTKSKEHLKESHPYIEEDIKVLQPDYIVLPHVNDKAFIKAIKGKATVIYINQMNSGVINRTIARLYSRYDVKALPKQIIPYYEGLHDNGIIGKTKVNYLSVFSYLDKRVEESRLSY